MTLSRKSDRIKAIRSSSDFESKSISPHGIDLSCINCSERYYFIELESDNNNVFCTYCGHLTPIRQLKRLRGIQAPDIQQGTSSIIQASSDKAKAGKRRPISMINKPIDPAIESLAQSGNISIIDSQTNTVQ